MKRKLIKVLCGVSLFGVLLFTGCSSVDVKSLAAENVSEKVDVYFSGSGVFKASLSSGQREDPYIYNGKSAKKVDFAIVTIYAPSDAEMIEAEIVINGESETKVLEVNLITGSYVVDLEKIVSSDDEVSINYAGSTVKLDCKSKDFAISSDRALEIGIEAFNDDLNTLISQKQLMAECYVRVLESSSREFDKTFWYFYIYAENGVSYSCVISHDVGEIIVKN